LTELRQKLIGRRITAIARRGKYLQIHLFNGPTLLIHLKMSGNLLVEPAAQIKGKHVHTRFALDNGNELRFRDARKFGRVYLVDDPEEITGKLGPEPLADSFDESQFADLFRNRSARLKPLLLNQEFISGLGNIYACESCFLAGLAPERKVDTLSSAELGRLYRAIRQSLREGIVHKGATLDDVYPGGEFQFHFRVYGRDGEPCLICGDKILRIVLGARSTFYCPSCQN
jgi:formamidopyrimidine-DNA glycosylase